jgi:hypothetical protein
MSNKTNTPAVKSSKRGRPTVTGSKRQAVLAMRAAKVAAGGTIQRGRPKMVKTETVIEVPVAGKKLTARAVNKNVAVLSIEDMISNDAK